jgi:hypothetical protein
MQSESDNDTRCVERRVGFTESGDHAVSPALGWAEIDKEHLVVLVIDDVRQFGAEADKIRRGELALEDGVLQMVAEAAHEPEDFAQALVIADVVANEIGIAHRFSLRLFAW